MGQLDEEDSPVPLFVAEIRTSHFDRSNIASVRVPTRFPGIEVDLTLTHGMVTTWSDLEGAIDGARTEDLVDFGLKDRYSGPGVPKGAVNTTIYFVYNAGQRTLTQEEVNERHQGLRGVLESRCGWKGESNGDQMAD